LRIFGIMGQPKKEVNDKDPLIKNTGAVVYVDSSKEKWSSKLFWILITFLVALASAGFGAWLGATYTNQGAIDQWNQTISHEREQQELTHKNIAQALAFDVATLRNRFDLTLNYINNTPVGDSTTDGVILFETNPYYNSGGLYYVFSKDIANFKDAQLSFDLYDFYNRVEQIEIDRSYLQQTHEKYFGSNETTMYFPGSVRSEIIAVNSDMYVNMILANRDAARILTKLKNDYDLSPTPRDVFSPAKTFYLFNVSVRIIPNTL